MIHNDFPIFIIHYSFFIFTRFANLFYNLVLSFLIGDYKDGYTIIINNLVEDWSRFYSFININFITIDTYLALFVLYFY